MIEFDAWIEHLSMRSYCRPIHEYTTWRKQVYFGPPCTCMWPLPYGEKLAFLLSTIKPQMSVTQSEL